jgi:hypothetical protein
MGKNQVLKCLKSAYAPSLRFVAPIGTVTQKLAPNTLS